MRLSLPLSVAAVLLCVLSAAADDIDQLKVGPQPDGRIITPTNQVLRPAGRQVTFPGRPVDLALAEDGAVLVVKNMRDLVFIDLAAAKIKQTLTIPKAGFGVVGLMVRGDRVYVGDNGDTVRTGAAEGRRDIRLGGGDGPGGAGDRRQGEPGRSGICTRRR